MAAARSPIPFPLPEDLSGSKVGRFEIRSKLGSGGMGEVYYAEDSALRRPVALKRVARRLGNDPKARPRILREAQRASVLSSEHIAGIHDVLEEGGELFLVMEYVEGETLRQRLQRPLSLEQFFHIATQCAQALAAAHEHGIVHCDIKPENIMLTPEGQVKILDFGLAKHLPRSDQSTTMEGSQMLAGTPAYMAPEILMERLPDGRTDIFSLGVVFYEMLTLTAPFGSGSFAGTVERTLHETPKPLRTLNPSVPAAVETIISKMLAKDPALRQASAHELMEELGLAQAGALPAGTLKLATRRRALRIWAAAAVVMVAIAVAAFTVRWWRHRPPILHERGWVLISDFDTSGDTVIPDKAVREGLTIALQQSEYVNVFPRNRAYEVLRRMKKEDTSRIDENLGREICQRENLQVLLAGSVERMGQVFQIRIRGLDPVRGSLLFAEQARFDRENQFFEKADELVKKVRTDLGESLERIEKRNRPLAQVTTSSLEALQLYSQAQDASNQGRSEQVPVLLKGALRLDPDFAMAHLRLGLSYLAVVGKNQKAVEELTRAYELRQGVTEREQRRIEAAYYGLQEQYDDEAQSLRELVSLYPDDEEGHQALADAYFELAQLDNAVLELQEVLRLHATSAVAYQNLLLYLVYKGEPKAAIASYGEAQQRGVESPRMHWGLGLAHLGQGDVSTARQEFQSIGQATETDWNLAELYAVMTDLYEGKLESAKDAIASQLRPMEAQSQELQPFRHYLLGRIHLIQGHPSKARLQAALILKMPRTALQVVHLLNVGVLYVRSGETGQARQILRQLDDVRRSVPSTWNQSCFHNLEGEIALADAKPQQAETFFLTAAHQSPQFFSHAGLARSYEAQKRWTLAAQEWEQVLGRKAEILQNDFPPDLAYAHLQLARAYRALNKRELARNHYEEVLRMWQHADELPLLKDAQRESEKLSSEDR